MGLPVTPSRNPTFVGFHIQSRPSRRDGTEFNVQPLFKLPLGIVNPYGDRSSILKASERFVHLVTKLPVSCLYAYTLVVARGCGSVTQPPSSMRFAFVADVGDVDCSRCGYPRVFRFVLQGWSGSSPNCSNGGHPTSPVKAY